MDEIYSNCKLLPVNTLTCEFFCGSPVENGRAQAARFALRRRQQFIDSRGCGIRRTRTTAPPARALSRPRNPLFERFQQVVHKAVESRIAAAQILGVEGKVIR